MLSWVEEVNQPWARFASVLALGCGRLTLERTGLAYETAEHDLGLASANLVFEATARGLAVDQMIHIHRDQARQLYQIPEGVKPVAALAIGYAGKSIVGWVRTISRKTWSGARVSHSIRSSSSDSWLAASLLVKKQ